MLLLWRGYCNNSIIFNYFDLEVSTPKNELIEIYLSEQYRNSALSLLLIPGQIHFASILSVHFSAFQEKKAFYCAI